MDVLEQVADLVEECRDRCLWFLRPDYVPTTDGEIHDVLDLIERYGDRAAYVRAEEIRAWLSQASKPMS
ncbi:MAG: hypothetical protein BWZ02_02407 [Lentisphaerae bacterium ADurb.BinA184]|nr:MAG: hypothetical protein BWZ02_02407 [Lentisphaerae bacterium ADurb.BinA184]